MRPAAGVQPAAAHVLDALVGHIDKVLDEFYEFGVRTQWQEQEVSPFAEERGRLTRQYGPGRSWPPAEVFDWDAEPANYAAVSGVLFTSLAGQHLEGLRVLLKERHVIFAPAPSARAILEITGFVFWLLDPTLTSVRDRAARVELAKLNDATRRKTAGLAVSHPDSPKFGAEVRRLRKESIPALFYPSERSQESSGAIRLRGQSYPGLEEALAFIAKGSGVHWNTSGAYAYLSNASHPTLHVILESLQTKDGKVTGFGHEDATLPYRITRLSIMSFIRCWQLCAGYHGLDSDRAGDLGEEIDNLPEP